MFTNAFRSAVADISRDPFPEETGVGCDVEVAEIVATLGVDTTTFSFNISGTSIEAIDVVVVADTRSSLVDAMNEGVGSVVVAEGEEFVVLGVTTETVIGLLEKTAINSPTKKARVIPTYGVKRDILYTLTQKWYSHHTRSGQCPR
jgi:hypothetical protein